MSGDFHKIKRKNEEISDNVDGEEFLDDKVQKAIEDKIKINKKKEQDDLLEDSRNSLKAKTPSDKVKKKAIKTGAVAGGKGMVYGSSAVESGKFLGKIINTIGQYAQAMKTLATPQGFKAIAGAFFKNVGSKIGGFFKGVTSNSLFSTIGSGLSSAAHFIGGGLVSAGNGILSVFGIGGASANMAAVVAVTPALLAGSVLLFSNIGNDVTKFDGRIVECIDEINAARKGYGKGEIVIPEKIKGMRVGYATTWECPYDWAVKNIGKGTNQRKVVEMWGGPDGTKADENGFGRVKDYYLVAIRVNAYGQKDDEEAQIGDHITFYLSDGTAIETMVWDAKGPTSGTDGATGKHFDYLNGTSRDEEHTMAGHGRFNGWGHIAGSGPYEVNILEFAGNVSENNHLEKITGKKGLRVASATNHGPAPEWVKYNAGSGSVPNASNDTKKKSKSKRLGQMLNTCLSGKVGKYDNSSIAKAAVSFAYPRMEQGEHNNGTELYQRVHDNVGFKGRHYMDCGFVVCSAILWSGADDDFPLGSTSAMAAYCETSPRWKKVGTWGGSIKSKDDLAPGDVFIVNQGGGAGSSGHTFLYVGQEIIQEIHGDKANPKSDCVSGSLHQRSAACDSSADWNFPADSIGRGQYSVYRCVDPMNSDKNKYAGDK